jgi:uncharacterized protein YkwD
MMLSKLTTVSRRTTLAAISLAAIGASFAMGATPALASTTGDLVAATNASRSGAGLPALTENAQLDAVASAWAQKLAASNVLSHNPNIQTQVTSWNNLGENVGMGPSVPALEQAFMASPDHRANILDTNYTQVGVGTATSTYPTCNCTILWVVVDFRRPSTAPVAVAPHAPATPPVAPKPPATPRVSHPAATTRTQQALPSTPPTPHATATPSASPSVTVPPVASQAGTAAPSSAPLASSLALGSEMTNDSVTPTTGNDPVSSVLDFASSLAALS